MKEGGCYKIKFFVICSVVLFACSLIALHNAYGMPAHFSANLTGNTLCDVLENNVVKQPIAYYGATARSLYSNNTTGTCIPAQCTTVANIITEDTGKNQKSLYAGTLAGNEMKQRIAMATQRARALLQKTTHALSLEEEAMLPHHSSFIKLRKISFHDDAGNIRVNAVLHKNEYGVDSNWQMLASSPPMVCISFLCYIAITYCYERFYYRQREAYPQSCHLLLLSHRHSIVLFLQHSGKTHHATQTHDESPTNCRRADTLTYRALLAAVMLQKVLLPVTIAHATSTYTITTITTMEVL